MGYSLWGPKESDVTEHLILSLWDQTQVSRTEGRFFTI